MTLASTPEEMKVKHAEWVARLEAAEVDRVSREWRRKLAEKRADDVSEAAVPNFTTIISRADVNARAKRLAELAEFQAGDVCDCHEPSRLDDLFWGGGLACYGLLAGFWGALIVAWIF